MNQMVFSCGGCVFAKVDKESNLQVGCCVDDRHKKLSTEQKLVNGFFEFNRFCNTYRPQRWMDEHCQSLKEAVSQVKEEVYPRLSFIIKFNKDLSFLKNLLENINNQTINARKFVVVLNDNVAYNLEAFSLMSETLKNNVGGFNLIQVVDSSKGFDEGFTYAKNGWAVFLEEGQSVERNFAETLNNRVNNQLQRLVYAKNKDSTKIIVQSSIYKSLGCNQPVVMSDGTVDNRCFEERLADMSYQDSESITEWEKVFNE